MKEINKGEQSRKQNQTEEINEGEQRPIYSTFNLHFIRCCLKLLKFSKCWFDSIIHLMQDKNEFKNELKQPNNLQLQ